MTKRVVALFIGIAAALSRPAVSQAEIIFLDFGANWQTRLGELATSAGIDALDAGERTTLQNDIQSRLQTMYSSFSGVSFTQTSPGGTFTTVRFGEVDAGGTLGVAGLDFGNLSTSQNVDVFTANFDFIVDEFTGSTNRAQQLDQLGAALSGTAGHELGHSFGGQHHHAYGTDGIDPSTYANTGGLQNQHVMATGPTGLDEVGRETNRTFSQFTNLTLEAAGGFNTTVFGAQPAARALAATPLAQTDNLNGGDIGDTAGTAFATTLQNMAISGLRAFTNISLLSSETDVDVFSFTANAGFKLFAQVWSDLRYTNDFDGQLRLLDTDGVTVLASNDDVLFSGNLYDGGTLRELDPTLMGITVAGPGTYYLEVSSVGNLNGVAGGNYSLIFGIEEDTASVPEPGSLTLCLVAAAGVGVVARRRRQRTGPVHRAAAAEQATAGSACSA